MITPDMMKIHDTLKAIKDMGIEARYDDGVYTLCTKNARIRVDDAENALEYARFVSAARGD